MKSISTLLVALTLMAWSMPFTLADDAVQNGTPGAQGTEGTNPTHQDSNVTGPNGNHPGDMNPADSPHTAHHKKHHHPAATSSTSTDSGAH